MIDVYYFTSEIHLYHFFNLVLLTGLSCVVLAIHKKLCCVVYFYFFFEESYISKIVYPCIQIILHCICTTYPDFTGLHKVDIM